MALPGKHAAYNGEGIKQADVTLLCLPVLKEITDPKTNKKGS